MTATLDHLPVRLPEPAGAHAWPDGAVIATSTSRLALIDRAAPHPVDDARLAAASACWDWHLPAGLLADVVQVVDALTTNALLHAVWTDSQPVVSITITLSGRRVAVEVRDPDPTLPVWHGAVRADLGALIDDPAIGPDDACLTHGFGLVDVAGRCETLGADTDHEAGGKCVRAVLLIPAGGMR